jgi:hypothetical protein
VNSLSEKKLFSHLLLGQINNLATLQPEQRSEIQNRMLFLYGQRTDDIGNLVFQHQEFWLELANKKSKLHKAFDFTSMEKLWNEHMLIGAYDGQIRLSRDLILPLAEVGVTTKNYLMVWAIAVAKQLVNRVLVPGLDARPVHEGPAGGTQGVSLLGCASEVAQAAFEDLGVDAFDMSPANTIGAPLVPPSFNSSAAQAALGVHLHANRTDYKLCSGCHKVRKSGGRWHAHKCPVVYLSKAEEYASRVAAGRAFRKKGPRKSKSKSADDLFYFMGGDEKDTVRIHAAMPQPRGQKRGRGAGASTVCDGEEDDDDGVSSSDSSDSSDSDSNGDRSGGRSGDEMEVDG